MYVSLLGALSADLSDADAIAQGVWAFKKPVQNGRAAQRGQGKDRTPQKRKAAVAASLRKRGNRFQKADG